MASPPFLGSRRSYPSTTAVRTPTLRTGLRLVAGNLAVDLQPYELVTNGKKLVDRDRLYVRNVKDQDLNE